MSTAEAKYGSKSREQMLDLLFREILAARLKIDLDEQLDRPTSDAVRRLAAMKLPRINRAE